MELEHSEVGAVLSRQRELSDDCNTPEWGCNSCRALMDGLLQFKIDLHQHVYKENNVLFPRAVALKQERQSS